MSVLSPSEIMNYASAAGCGDPVTAGAIAWAESNPHGNTDSHCLNCVPGVREDSRGLWQINVRANPKYAGWNLYDPAVNAQAMAELSRGCTNWRPWSTAGPSTGYAYRQYLGLFKLPQPGDLTPPDIGSGLPSEPSGDGAAQTPIDAGFVDQNPILSDLGVFPGGVPMWVILIALGVAAYLIVR